MGEISPSIPGAVMCCSTGMIVDILNRHDSRQFGLSGLFTRGAGALTKRSEPGEQAAGVDETDVQVAKAHHVVAGVEFSNAHEFVDQRLADEDKLAFPFDHARAADTANLMIGVIPGVLLARRHGARGSGVGRRRRSLAERFVRTFLVVMRSEPVKARLLLSGVRCRRGRGLCLQRAMHALMSAVLLRRGRMDEVRGDAELHPPGRQFGEAARAARAERRAIVAADRQRQAMLAKSPLKTRANAFDGGGDNPQFDQKAALTVRHRQRIDPSLVAGAEPALEIRAPFIIGVPHQRARPSLVERTTAPLYRRDQACALENGPDRRSGRPRDLGGLAIQHREKLARPQVRKAPPRRDHLLGNRSIRGLPTLQGRMRAVLKPCRIPALLPLAPLDRKSVV